MTNPTRCRTFGHISIAAGLLVAAMGLGCSACNSSSSNTNAGSAGGEPGGAGGAVNAGGAGGSNAGGGGAGGGANTGPVDLLLTHGKVYTQDENQLWAQRIAIRGGKIVAVGSDGELAPYASAAGRVIHLAGKVVLPGLQDIHQHPVEASTDFYSCFLSANVKLPQLKQELQACQPKVIPSGWILGHGHGVAALLDSNETPRVVLDGVFPNTPTMIMEQTSHSVWVNSAALTTLGLTAQSPNPPGGIIAKDPATSEPTGLLVDNAGNLALHTALAASPEMDKLRYEALLEAMKTLPAVGLTAIADARVYWKRNMVPLWKQAKSQGALKVRATLGLWAYPEEDDTSQLKTLAGLFERDPDNLLNITQVKMYSDGLLHHGTAELLQPYTAGDLWGLQTGLAYFDKARLNTYVKTLQEAGFDMHLHAIGDGGVAHSLDAIYAAKQALRGDVARHHLTHVELAAPADQARLVNGNVVVDFQPAAAFAHDDLLFEAEHFVGKQRTESRFFPMGQLWQKGARVTLSSDWDVGPVSPFQVMARALAAGTTRGLPNVEAAIAAYTVNAAWALRLEGHTGVIRSGMYGDLAVLDRDIFEVPTAEIGNIRPVYTIMAGKLTYEGG